MAFRKWLVRGLVFAIVVGCAGAVFLYQRFTNPAAVRQQVLTKFRGLFPGAYVTLDSARLRIMGGISVGELRLSRQDDPDHAELVRVPSATLYHDKEKLLNGEMCLRKIELHKPRLRVERNVDGSWNVQGLTGQVDPTKPLPMLVVQEGCVEFVDRTAHGTGLSIELTDVNLTLINDPVDVINIEGSATSNITGPVKVEGQWQRVKNGLTLTLKAGNVPLNPGWAERIVCTALADRLSGLHVEGKADVRAELAYRPAESVPLSYDVRLAIREGKLRHPQLPLPLDRLDAVIQVAAGEVRLEKLQAQSGDASIEGRALARLPNPEQSFEAHLEIRHLPLTDAVFAPLPEKIRKLQTWFQPRGLATLRVDAARQNGQWVNLANGEPSTATLLPEELAVEYQKFPYPVEKVTGTITHQLAALKTDVDVTVYAGDRPVVIKGTWEGEGDKVKASIDILASDVPMEEKLVAALPATWQQQARAYNATGKVDIKAHLRHEPDQATWSNEFHLRFHDVALSWDNYPYALEKVSGFLDIYPKHWEFQHLQGTHRNGGKIFVDGHTVQRQDGTLGLILELSGKQVALDDDLRRALGSIPGMQKCWDSLQPRGRFDFKTLIDRSDSRPDAMQVNVNLQGATVVPTFFRYQLDNVAAQLRYQRQRLEVTRLYARRRDAEISVSDGTIDLHPSGGYYVDWPDLRFRKLPLDDELVPALPLGLQGAVKSLKFAGLLAGKTRLVVAQGEAAAPPDLFWDGQVWFPKADFATGLQWSDANGTLACRGRYNGRQLVGVNGNLLLEQATLLKQPLRNFQASFMVKEDAPDALLLNLRAPIYGGDITGQARIEFSSSLRYEMNLTASQIQLEEFGRHNLGANSQLSGLAVGRLYLTGTGAKESTLDGSGSIDVPTGQLLNLPLLLDLLKFLGLRWPDRTAFEEMHAQFTIHGARVNVGRLELLGSAVSLYGKGAFNLDGSDVELDFYPSWARVEQLLPAMVRPFPPAISRHLLTIEMRGKVSADPKEVKFFKKPVPILVDPLLYIRDRMTGPHPTVGAAPRQQTPAEFPKETATGERP